jgi:hypothetical protein
VAMCGERRPLHVTWHHGSQRQSWRVPTADARAWPSTTAPAQSHISTPTDQGEGHVVVSPPAGERRSSARGPSGASSLIHLVDNSAFSLIHMMNQSVGSEETRKI